MKREQCSNNGKRVLYTKHTQCTDMTMIDDNDTITDKHTRREYERGIYTINILYTMKELYTTIVRLIKAHS